MNVSTLKESIMNLHKHKNDDHYQVILEHIRQYGRQIESGSAEIIATLLPVVNSLLTHKDFKYKGSEFVEAIDALLQQALLLIIENLNNDQVKLSEVFRSIFDPNKNYFEYNNLEADIEKIVFILIKDAVPVRQSKSPAVAHADQGRRLH